MTGLFSAVLSMSLIASLTAAVVLLIRWYLKRRAPRWISYGLWVVVLIRLLVPVSVASPISLFSLVPTLHSAETVGQNGHLSRLAFTEGGVVPMQSPQNGEGRQSALVAAQKALPKPAGEKIQVGAKNPPGAEGPAAKQKGKPDWLKFGAIIWLCGAIVLSGCPKMKRSAKRKSCCRCEGRLPFPKATCFPCRWYSGSFVPASCSHGALTGRTRRRSISYCTNGSTSAGGTT